MGAMGGPSAKHLLSQIADIVAAAASRACVCEGASCSFRLRASGGFETAYHAEGGHSTKPNEVDRVECSVGREGDAGDQPMNFRREVGTTAVQLDELNKED